MGGVERSAARGAFCRASRWVAAALLGMAAIACASDPEAVDTQEKAIPFNLSADQIHVKARIDGGEKDYDFLVDTGSGLTLVSREVADSLGLRRIPSLRRATDSEGNSRRLDMARLDCLEVGGTRLRGLRVAVTDFGRFEAYGLSFDGILGTSFMHPFVVEIDYEASSLRFAKEAKRAEKAEDLNEIPFVFRGGAPTLRLGLADGSAVDAIVDTGWSGSSLIVPMRLLARLEPLLDCDLVRTRGAMTGGAFGEGSGEVLARIGEIRLGRLDIERLPVAFTGAERVILPGEFLSHFRLSIDYPRRRLLLAPIEGRRFEDNIRSFGYMVRTNPDGSRVIGGVIEGSPAEEAGLRPGDRIVREAYDISGILRLGIEGKNGGEDIDLVAAPLLKAKVPAAGAARR